MYSKNSKHSSSKGNRLKIVDLKASGLYDNISSEVFTPKGPRNVYFYPRRTLYIRILGVKGNEHMKVCGSRGAHVVASTSVSGSRADMPVLENMNDFFTLSIGSEADVVKLTLHIEEEIVGFATLRVDSSILSKRADFLVDGASELNIENINGFPTTSNLLLHVHWEDDEHILREVGLMHYRVVEKRGIRLMRSPWLQSEKTRKKVKVGELLLISERLTDTDGYVWVKLSKTNDQPNDRDGWMVEADGDKKWLERLTRKWTKAAAALVVQKRLRGMSSRARFSQIKEQTQAAKKKLWNRLQ